MRAISLTIKLNLTYFLWSHMRKDCLSPWNNSYWQSNFWVSLCALLQAERNDASGRRPRESCQTSWWIGVTLFSVFDCTFPHQSSTLFWCPHWPFPVARHRAKRMSEHLCPWPCESCFSQNNGQGGWSTIACQSQLIAAHEMPNFQEFCQWADVPLRAGNQPWWDSLHLRNGQIWQISANCDQHTTAWY